MLYLYSSVVDESQLNMFFVKPNRFRSILELLRLFELSSIDKVMATGFRKCFVCGSMKNDVCFQEGDDVFFCVIGVSNHTKTLRGMRTRARRRCRKRPRSAREFRKRNSLPRSAEDGNSLPGVKGRPLSGQGRKPCPVNCRCDNSYWVLLAANAR